MSIRVTSPLPVPTKGGYTAGPMHTEIKAGDTFTHERECDRYLPIYYAAVSGDFNPIHIDREAGEIAGLGGAVLHGLCTLAWAVEPVARLVGDPGKIRRVKTRFSLPVSPEDTVRFTGKVAKVEDGKLVVEIAATNQRGQEVLKNTVVEASL